MRPKLSKAVALTCRGIAQQKPDQIDEFERTASGHIVRLTMAIEQGNVEVSDLENQLREAKERLTKQVGEYEGWSTALASYIQGKQALEKTEIERDKKGEKLTVDNNANK